MIDELDACWDVWVTTHPHLPRFSMFPTEDRDKVSDWKDPLDTWDLATTIFVRGLESVKQYEDLYADLTWTLLRLVNSATAEVTESTS
jgi:hypothetical protein